MKDEVSAWRMELDKAKRCVAAMKTYSEINQEMLENIPPQALKKSAPSPKIEGPTAAPSSGQVESASNVSVKIKPPAVVVTAEELKDYSMFRTEAGRKSVVTVLRHFQKIRES